MIIVMRPLKLKSPHFSSAENFQFDFFTLFYRCKPRIPPRQNLTRSYVTEFLEGGSAADPAKKDLFARGCYVAYKI